MTHIDAAYESLRPRTLATLAQFVASLDGCDVHPVTVDGMPAGAIVVKGPEIHACVMPWARGRWFSRRCLRVLNAVILKHGYAHTQATTTEGGEFVTQLGFTRDATGYRKEGVWASRH